MAAANPFEALLSDSKTSVGISKALIEQIFLFTLRKDAVARSGMALLSLADVIVQDTGGESTMSEELLSHALFERLMLTDPKKHLLRSSDDTATGSDEAGVAPVLETGAIKYLHRSFVACTELAAQAEQKSGDFDQIRQLILTNASTCMRQPELFPHQSLPMQWMQILQEQDEQDPTTRDFLVLIVEKVIADDDALEAIGALKAIFYPMLTELQKQIAPANIVSIKQNVFCTLGYFVSDKRLAPLGEILIDYTTPNPHAKGGEYMDTLFGQLLSLSIMPKHTNGPYEYFGEITTEWTHTDPSLWQLLSTHQQAIFSLVKQLLTLNATTKHKTLQWVGNCLHANAARGHLWNNVSGSFEQMLNQNASDAFMVGLSAVLLCLCMPLCEPTMKVLLVDPTYCAVPETERAARHISMLRASEETCLLPTDEQETRLIADKYIFVTELFYMTHKSYELGFRACVERYTRMTRELHSLQNAYQDVMATDPNNDMAKNLLRMLKEQTQQYLCMRNGLMEPKNDMHVLKFFEASAVWLAEIALVTPAEFEASRTKNDYAPHERRDRELPAGGDLFVPPYLQSVPECIVDNIVAYLNFSRLFPPGQYIEVYHSAHNAFFKMFVLLMGNAQLVKNPHLRAKLAEGLEFLLPKRISGSMRSSFLTHVFDNHPDRHKVVRSLLDVFVSIEMTGQSVQFEQKFNYRRPMYAIMEFLWSREDQVQCFRDLAEEAEHNMEAIEPPLFLRFINLLINDAIFLLDESLSNLEQIRQLQDAQDSGEWNSLSANERQQQISNLHHLGMLARFDNILARDTINVLKLLTIEIKSIFCHNSMVDRVASMLNYFLLSLVGPQKEKFKVKDKKEFEFDPAQTVLEICRIYIHLSGSDRFCLAVSQDGRSYSAQLFGYAESILIRIGGGQLIGEMTEFAAHVQQAEAQYKQEQEFLSDAPDEYLDPIMSTLMTDPVLLPSSNVTVDRTTIARHLLSDQTDPFNRAPLTMDKVQTNTALKTEIENWIAEKRAAGRASS